MQTFITYKPIPELLDPFIHTARSLDYRRLGKQRVEAKQILQALLGQSKGWTNHPATKMWRGYEDVLCVYAIDICNEWRRRGYKDSLTPYFQAMLEFLQTETPMRLSMPDWLQGQAGEQFIDAHRSNLIRKDPEYYGPKFPGVPDHLEYIWPVK